MDLYKHNQIAYESVVKMLEEVGKAAIIHPTGTGKSFIGFKLCEDNPQKTVCWISPSEYIFKTQVENWKRANDGAMPMNIRFLTYAKLMLVSQAEIDNIAPQFIVLDEFHRCGAEMWGQGVQALLRSFPTVPILGLSATNIRYLDNQRDMADELFDGNIASEITLGEAIVRGILSPPGYVLSVYSYQKDLEKYERRIRLAKSKSVRDVGGKYLEALRRTIEKADGLDVVFEKHMTDKTGKYIVFCSSKEHMDEMQTHIAKWFSRIDPNPHVYSVYTEDASANKSFQAFKADADERHLRLLYAIDALNEGIHVEDVSGVILLRPTISPIVFKQQIGRALSASKSKEPIIFDIVNNIENLYSIGAIEEEMQVAIDYYRSLGEDKEIVRENFKIYDDVRDCKALFERLEETLCASWDMMYECAKAYFVDHGHLEIPKRYTTKEGYSLGTWLSTQRKVRAGKVFGSLDRRRIAKLNAIGMRWESASDISWQRFYLAAKKYYETYGDLNVKATFITNDGMKLGRWISNMRTYKSSGIKTAYLTEERIELLEKIGMVWSQIDYVWEKNYYTMVEFNRKNGHSEVPADYVAENGVRLGDWLFRLRKQKERGKLTDEQVRRLESLGVTWSGRFARLWEEGFAEAKKYYQKFGTLPSSRSYTTAKGFRLGDWLSNQRERFQTGKLETERKERLDGIGMVWEREDSWSVRFRLAKEYFEQCGDLKIPANYRVDGIWLNKWINEQRQMYRGNRKTTLSQEKIALLESIGMVW